MEQIVNLEMLMSVVGQLPMLASSARVMLADEVYSILQQAILDGSIPPDERVNVGELGRKFEVSPTPIREALARLEADGLVEKLPLRGYRTTDLLNRGELVDLFELRLLLEPGSAALAAERRDDADSHDLEREILTAHAAIGEIGAYRRLSLHDVRLHDLVFRAARNETVRHAYARTHCHLHTFRLAYTGAYVADTVEEHAAVVRAIQLGNPDAAESAMRLHITQSRDRQLRVFD